jgi:hypothetical protein
MEWWSIKCRSKLAKPRNTGESDTIAVTYYYDSNNNCYICSCGKERLPIIIAYGCFIAPDYLKRKI